jgi:hypothetical protein
MNFPTVLLGLRDSLSFMTVLKLKLKLKLT